MSDDKWEKFRITGTLPELTTVRHIAHVPTARRIIEDEEIKAGLVYDESRLNRSRLSVVWLSANTWVNGSIYGTVEFQFSWSELVAGRPIYWVESIDRYNPPAYRFLVTGAVVPAELCQQYDPTIDDGPLKRKDDKWFWNGNYTSEFMIDQNLSLARCKGLNFVEHHPKICRIDGPQCSELTAKPLRTAGRVLSYILGHELHVLDTHLRPTGDDPANRDDLLDDCLYGLQELTHRVRFRGQINEEMQCESVSRGALALLGMDRSQSACELLGYIASKAQFDNALTAIVRKHFEVPKWQMSGG
jgi:hypothetical protein